MIYIEFKNKAPIGIKKYQYARVLARFVSVIKHLKSKLRCKDSGIDVDYKIIFK